MLSIIIPTFQEQRVIANCLFYLNQQQGNFEVFVSDGSSTDQTLSIVATTFITYPLKWEVAPTKGRSTQMNWGVTQTRGDILLFLHADTILPPEAVELIESAIQNGAVGGRFDVQLDDPQFPYPLISWLINLRTRWTHRCTGDMAIFVRRDVFEQLKGFPEQPLMEDLAFSQQLYRFGMVAELKTCVTTSARRWQKFGILKTFLLMQLLRTAYALGISPVILQRWYAQIR